MDPSFTDSLWLIVLLIGLIVTSVFLAAAEAALLRVSTVRAEVSAEGGDRRAARVVALLADLPRVLNAVLLVVLLAQIGAGTVSGYIADRHFGNAGVTLTTVGLTLIMFVYAEAIPKTYAVRHPMTVARRIALPVSILAWLLRPLISVLVAFADLQAPGKGIATPVSVTEAELRRLAAQAADSGAIEHTDHQLIERAFALGDERVDAILVPRIRVVAVAGDMDASAALAVALESGHRRLPVLGSSIDHVTGVVTVRDLARVVAADRTSKVAALQQPVLVVPETARVIDVLRSLQDQARHLAVVVDEHGGTAGIVTIEDVVEELVGRIAADGEEPAIRQLGPGRWVADGTADVDDLAAALGVGLPTGDWHTVAGLVIGLAGRIPSRGDRLEVEGHVIRVTVADTTSVREVAVHAVDSG